MTKTVYHATARGTKRAKLMTVCHGSREGVRHRLTACFFQTANHQTHAQDEPCGSGV